VRNQRAECDRCRKHNQGCMSNQYRHWTLFRWQDAPLRPPPVIKRADMNSV